MRKQIPKALVDPIAIFDSETHPGDLVFLLDVKDAKGINAIAPRRNQLEREITG